LHARHCKHEKFSSLCAQVDVPLHEAILKRLGSQLAVLEAARKDVLPSWTPWKQDAAPPPPPSRLSKLSLWAPVADAGDGAGDPADLGAWWAEQARDDALDWKPWLPVGDNEDAAAATATPQAAAARDPGAPPAALAAGGSAAAAPAAWGTSSATGSVTEEPDPPS
jgi:hypothetical protein